MTLRSVNQLLLAKHNMMINVTERLHARLNQSNLNRGEIDNFESFLNTQQAQCLNLYTPTQMIIFLISKHDCIHTLFKVLRSR